MILSENSSGPENAPGLENAPERFASFSARVYQALLFAYPYRFRRDYGLEMAQVFRAASRNAARNGGFWKILRLWRVILPDLLVTILAEWRSEMKTKNLLPLAAGAALLVPALVFLTLVFLGYALNVSSVRQPFDTFYSPSFGGWSRVADIFVLGGPVLAVLLNSLPFLRALKVKVEGEGAASITLTRINLISLAILVIGLGLMAIFVAYFFTENWQCIIGAKTSC